MLCLEKAGKELKDLICQKIVTKSSILDHGKGPGFPPDYNVICAKSHLSFSRNLIQYPFMRKTALYGNWKNHILLQQAPYHCSCLKSSFCYRSSVLSAVNYCHKKFHLRCCRHHGSVFDDNICQKAIFIWWRQPSNLIQQPSHLWKQPSTVVIRKSYFSRDMQVSVVEDNPGLFSISQMDVFSIQINDFHKLGTIVTDSSILDVRRDPEPISAMILANK